MIPIKDNCNGSYKYLSRTDLTDINSQFKNVLESTCRANKRPISPTNPRDS